MSLHAHDILNTKRIWSRSGEPTKNFVQAQKICSPFSQRISRKIHSQKIPSSENVIFAFYVTKLAKTTHELQNKLFPNILRVN